MHWNMYETGRRDTICLYARPRAGSSLRLMRTVSLYELIRRHGSNKGHTGASFFGLWAREASGLRGVHHWWQLAYDNSSHRRATVDTVGIAWRLIVHDRSIARRTRLGLLQRSCTLSRSTASMEFGHTYRLGAYTPTRERREMKSTAQLSTLSQPPVRPFEGTGSHHLGIPSVHLMRPSNTRSTKVAQLSAPERSEASPT